MASSFFKILLDPSADHLSLPPRFSGMYSTNSPTISTNGGHSWRLKFKKIDDNYCFADGWKNVVQDIGLRFGDFIFFRTVDESTFRMSIYSPDGCEKILAPTVDHENYDHDEKNEENSDDDPSFMLTFTGTHTRLLRFPAGFADLARIDGEGPMTVKNVDGKEWVAGLKLDKSFRSTKRYLLSSGWPRFCRENELSEGDEFVFKFITSEGKLLLAKVTKKKCQLPVTHEHAGAVDPAQEYLEVINKPVEMPPKRSRGRTPQQKRSVLYF